MPVRSILLGSAITNKSEARHQRSPVPNQYAVYLSLIRELELRTPNIPKTGERIFSYKSATTEIDYGIVRQI